MIKWLSIDEAREIWPDPKDWRYYGHVVALRKNYVLIRAIRLALRVRDEVPDDRA